MKLPIVLLFACAAYSNAQVLVTNYQTAASNFREVNGQLYNIEKSANWIKIHIEVRYQSEGLLFALCSKPYVSTFIRPGREPEKIIGYNEFGLVALTNNPPFPNSTETNIFAIKTGLTKDGYELWDCGKPHVVAVTFTNSIPR